MNEEYILAQIAKQFEEMKRKELKSISVLFLMMDSDIERIEFLTRVTDACYQVCKNQKEDDSGE